MKIIFSGGGTLGPVTPLLAIKDIIKEKYFDADFLWVGTKTGPEKELIEKEGITFLTLSSGKFRRYISAWNIIDIGRIVVGFFQSISLLLKESPDVCISAGGFISVPLHFAAWFLGIPTWIHQQDVRIGLANRLMSPCAKKITTSLDVLTKSFPKRKTQWIGNPVRRDVLEGDKAHAKKIFKLTSDAPVVFATGGGTGSLRVNQLIVEAMEHLKGYAQVIHLSGKERPQELVSRAEKLYDYYQVHQFFTDEMKHAYAVADIVISRGGFGTLTEIAALGKPAIIIPKPGHQVENVRFLEQAHAAVLVNERTSDGLYLGKQIRTLLQDEVLRKQLAHNLQKLLPRAEDAKILEIVEKLVG
ncbi:MAG: UDP-N-acetylglucosamine--N-acetylmuramyl-(pentapeptide) pyrophosphoryl-undecaprenol N-acetylglucosamine transferase [Candidatus Magasanikbacteria bacterium]